MGILWGKKQIPPLRCGTTTGWDRASVGFLSARGGEVQIRRFRPRRNDDCIVSLLARTGEPQLALITSASS